MEDEYLIILSLCKINQNIVKEVSELEKEQDKSKIAFHHMSTFFIIDSRLINDLRKENQDQVILGLLTLMRWKRSLLFLMRKFWPN